MSLKCTLARIYNSVGIINSYSMYIKTKALADAYMHELEGHLEISLEMPLYVYISRLHA